MCASCGCGANKEAGEEADEASSGHTHEHAHPHGHDHAHPHDHARSQAHSSSTMNVQYSAHSEQVRAVTLEARILAKNDERATANRAWLHERSIVALNLMSSPGAGKTTLLERTLRDLASERPLAVIEGDQETARDADRIRAAGARAVQINTGAGCHLDAERVARALDELSPTERSLLFIENVGNLVCPALFDLGERARVVVASVTEGDDKPLKYPHMFRVADVVVLNKIDLLPYVVFDVERFAEHVRRVNPRALLLTTSATRGDGLEGLNGWYCWLESVGDDARGCATCAPSSRSGENPAASGAS